MRVIEGLKVVYENAD